MEDRTCGRLVERLGCTVLAARYRLGPEHPFPAGLDDLHQAFHWLVEQGHGPIAIAGESAGGGLAAELCQRLRDEGGPQPVAQALVYPMLDDRTCLDEALTAGEHLVWNNRSNHAGWSAWLGHAPGRDQVAPYAVAARCEDLAGLPPAWLMVGDRDLFLQECRAYAARLKQAGVQVEVLEIAGGMHAMFSGGLNEPPVLAVWTSLLDFLAHSLGQGTDGAPSQETVT